jgi:hypothetical protein
MSDTGSRGAELEPEFWTAEEELRARVRQQQATGRLGLAALSGMGLPDTPYLSPTWSPGN